MGKRRGSFSFLSLNVEIEKLSAGKKYHQNIALKREWLQENAYLCRL